MLGKYAKRIADISAPAKRALRKEFGIRGRRSLVQELETLELNSADVVLALVHVNTDECREAAEHIMGKPITVYVPFVPRWPPKRPTVSTNPDLKRLVFVKPTNPKMPNTRAHHAFSLAKVGMTKTQLLSRGVTRRDIRSWVRAGHVEFER